MIPSIGRLANKPAQSFCCIAVPATAEAAMAILMSCWHAAAVADVQLLLKLC